MHTSVTQENQNNKNRPEQSGLFYFLKEEQNE